MDCALCSCPHLGSGGREKQEPKDGGKRGWFSSCQHSCSYKCRHEIGLEKDLELFGSGDSHFS